MKKAVAAAALTAAVAATASAQTLGKPPTPPEPGAHSMNVRFQDVKWDRIMPELGEGSPEISILRVDAKTKVTQLMIRVPKNFHVRRHWHSANETHTVISGTFIMECEGVREELGPGSFNYIPARMIHQAWTKPEDGALLFITVDSAWDVNWVEGPPQAPKNK